MFGRVFIATSWRTTLEKFQYYCKLPHKLADVSTFHAKIAMFYNILLKKVCIFQTMVSSDNDFSILFSDLVRHKVSVYFKVLYSAKTQLPKDFNFDKDRIFVVIVFLGSFLVCGSSFMSILRSVPEMKKVSCIGAQTRKPTIEEIINKNVFTKL